MPGNKKYGTDTGKGGFDIEIDGKEKNLSFSDKVNIGFFKK